MLHGECKAWKETAQILACFLVCCLFILKMLRCWSSNLLVGRNMICLYSLAVDEELLGSLTGPFSYLASRGKLWCLMRRFNFQDLNLITPINYTKYEITSRKIIKIWNHNIYKHKCMNVLKYNKMNKWVTHKILNRFVQFKLIF